MLSSPDRKMSKSALKLLSISRLIRIRPQDRQLLAMRLIDRPISMPALEGTVGNLWLSSKENRSMTLFTGRYRRPLSTFSSITTCTNDKSTSSSRRVRRQTEMAVSTVTQKIKSLRRSCSWDAQHGISRPPSTLQHLLHTSLRCSSATSR